VKLQLNPKRLLKESWAHLRQLRDAPHAIAGGVAIGIFWGFTPLTGLKTLFSIFTAWLFRCSKFPAVIAVAFHDILLPIWPVVLRWEYQLGFWILSSPHRFPPKLTINTLRVTELFQWKTLEVLWPTLLGSCLIGTPIALLCYWIVETLLERYETSHQRHLKPLP
jgi:hypothetical protein